MDVGEIVAGLAQLGREDLRRIRAACESLLGDERELASATDTEFALVESALWDALRRAGWAPPEEWAFRVGRNRKAIQKVVKGLCDYARGIGGPSRAEILRTLQFALTLFLREWRDLGRPLEIPLLCEALRHLPETMERAFPGYGREVIRRAMARGFQTWS